MMKRKTFWALLAAGITVVSTGLVRAQSEKNSLVGIWEETATFNDGSRIVRALIVYNKDGTLVATEGANPTLEPPPTTPPTPPSIASEDIGLWKQTASRTFEYINYVLFSDARGHPAGMLRVRGRYTLEDNDNYSGESFFEFLDENNQLVPGANGKVTNKGERLPFLPYPTPPQQP
jgi:hypothetical protein